MTHLLTGSDDGYIRDYNIFAAVNGKNFLTTPQRHHCGVVEGIMKAGQIHCWWENPGIKPAGGISIEEDLPLSPVYSLLMHTDALWALAGTNVRNFLAYPSRFHYTKACFADRAHQSLHRPA
jgi:transcriptional activator SPT8